MYKRILMMALALLIMAGAYAQLKDGHFFKTFENENVTAENAEQYFDQWFSLPAGTEWKQVSQGKDFAGMDRIEYRQYVGGIEVEHSQILLHAKDGKVISANGAVMEVERMPQEQPAAARRSSLVYKDGTPTDQLGRALYLIDTKDGYRYAYKTLSADKRYWIYTDVETGDELQRVPLMRTLTQPAGEAATAMGNSLYSGNVTMDVTKGTDGRLYLYDQKRNIHTLNGAWLPTYEEIDKMGKSKTYFPPTKDVSTYLFDGDNSSYISTDAATFSAYRLNKLTITKMKVRDLNDNLVDAKPAFKATMRIRYGIDSPQKKSIGVIENITLRIDALPVTFNLMKYQEVIPRDGISVSFEDEDFGMGFESDTLCLKPDASATGVTTVEIEGKNGTKVIFEYEPSHDPACDIHWGMGRTLDFYKEVFGRNSYDGNGSPVYNFVYLAEESDKLTWLDSDRNNAAAMADIKPYPMVYGMGGWEDYLNDFNMLPCVELSVMSHEFTHIVTEQTAKLVYKGESGALNESFSDLMGISCKKWNEPDAPWMIGTGGLMIGASDMRNMAFPKLSYAGRTPGPDTYKGMYWVDTESTIDDGGVHTNSSVQNKFFYLLSDGGEGTNDVGYSYKVTGIGIEKARKIAYLTLTSYAASASTYADIRPAFVKAAGSLYGDNSTETAAVKKAWDAVGVFENGVMPTAIDAVDMSTNSEQPSKVYNMMGQQVDKSHKGLVIYKGRKYINK